MFDDLIPTQKNTETPTTSKSNMFEDLVPAKKVKGANNNPALVKAIAPDNINDPTFSYDKNDSALTKVATAVGNTPKSLWNIGKGIYSAVRHPVDTVTNIANLVAGTAGVGAEKLIENTDLGQKFLQKANESRIARGIAPLKADADGKLQAEDTDQMKMAKNVGGYFKERYGGLDNIQKTAVEDPAGIALDVSALFSGGSTLAPKVAKVAEVAGMAKTASTISKVGNVLGKAGEITDPIRQSARIAKPIVTRKLNGLNDILSKSGTQLQSDALKEGLYGMNETVGTLKQKFENTSYQYKTPAGEIVDVNPIDTLSQYDLIPQPARGGSIDVSGIKAKIPALKKQIGDKIDAVLKTDSKTISIDDYAKQLDASIETLDKSKMFKQELAGKIESELETLQKAYPDGEIPLDEINKIRKEANGEFRDDKIDLARIRGNATREIVYGATDDMIVKDLLNEQRKLINAEDYASKLAIHKVKGGRLGNYVWGGIGSVIGASTKVPVVGEMAGYIGGRALSELAQRRQLKSFPADIKAGLEKVVGRPLKVDVKGGINKLFGQKSPNNTLQTNIPNTMPKSGSMDNIITPEDIKNYGLPSDASEKLSSGNFMIRGTRSGGGILGGEGGTWMTDKPELAKTFGDKLELVPAPKKPKALSYDELTEELRYVAKRRGADLEDFTEATKRDWDELAKDLKSDGYDAIQMSDGHMDGAKEIWIPTKN